MRRCDHVVRIERPAADADSAPAGRYPLAVVRAAATCLVALLVVASPWVVCRRSAFVGRPDDALRLAIADGDLRAMERAVAAGARVDGRNRSGMSPLAEAVSTEQVEPARWLLAHGADPNGLVSTGSPPLALALTRPRMVAVLIEAGADVEARLPGGHTLLLAACGCGSEETVLEVVDLLLRAGADVNAGCPGGTRPLAVAAEVGHPQVVRRLLAAGAAVNAVDSDGATALALAAAAGHAQVVTLLLHAGADPTPTPASYATNPSRPSKMR